MLDSLLASYPPLIGEAWIQMRGCYKATVDRPPPPSRVAIATMAVERVELYWHVTPQVEPILEGELNSLLYGAIPEDEEITWAVRRILLNRLGGFSGMRSEHLRQWLIAAMRDDSSDATSW